MNDTQPTLPVVEPEVEITTVVSAAVARNVAEKSCILEFAQSEPTFRKKVPAADILNSAEDPSIADIDPQRLSVSKALIENRELNDLLMNRRRLNRALKAIALPGGLLTLGGGQFLIPLSTITKVRTLIDEYIERRNQLLDSFEERYPAIIARAQEKLGGLFSENDYPSFPLIRDAYTVQYKFVSNSVPEELRKVSEELYEQERERVLTECAGAAIEIEDALRAGFLDLTTHFSDRLGVDETTGRPKQLHGSIVERVKEFVNTFQDVNLTGDNKLGELVAQAQGLLGNTDADMLRGDSNFRAQLKEGFDKIRETASTLIETRKRRVILE